MRKKAPIHLVLPVVCMLLLLMLLADRPTDVLSAPAAEGAGVWALSSCAPSITFTSVPLYGDTNDLPLIGQAHCMNPADYAVAVYISASGWYNKPTWADPLTPIQPDGTWQAVVVTHPNDRNATVIAAFLVPIGYGPPLLGGEAELPGELFNASVAHTHAERTDRSIAFAGRQWHVKQGAGLGPGPNNWSDLPEDVWVDAMGRLHLRIARHNDVWYSTEVFTHDPLGYGTYTFAVTSPSPNQINERIVLGLFTWDSVAPPETAYREIDFEFSRWGDAGNPNNSQYVLQPWTTAGHLHRFAFDAAGPSTHRFEWTEGRIEFESFSGDPTPENRVQDWVYSAADVPAGDDGSARINLWLLDGGPPSDGQEIEVIVEAFQYAPPSVVRVATNGSDGPSCGEPENPCCTIQYAIDRAADNGSVLVAGGTYAETVVLDKTLSLLGGYYAGTWSGNDPGQPAVLSGAGGGPVLSIEGGSTAKVEGFTITGGQGVRGVSIVNSAPVLRHNVIQGNTGGGVAISNGSPVLSHNRIVDNTGGAGAGVYTYGANARPIIDGNQIIGNSAGTGGGAFVDDYSSPRFINNVIARNGASSNGDGIYIDYYSKPTLINNTIVANTRGASWAGQGIFIYGPGAEPTIVNNIIASQRTGIAGTGALLDYNDLWDCSYACYSLATPGSHDMAVDPAFVDPSNDDYHLSPGSPLIDAGTPRGAPAADGDGDPRPLSGATDIGADEYSVASSDESFTFDFESTTVEGWQASAKSGEQGITAVGPTTDQAKNGLISLGLNVNLDPSNPDLRQGAALVMLPGDMTGRQISAWLRCPAIATGDPSHPNGVQLFVKDQKFRSHFGAWHNLGISVPANQWTEIVLTPGVLDGAGSHMDAGFDPSQAILIGLKLALGDGSTLGFQGTCYLDVVNASRQALAVPASDHVFDFDVLTDEQQQAKPFGHGPYWAVDPNWGAAAWGDGNIRPEEQALVVDANFIVAGDNNPERKGFVGVEVPGLDISNKGHRVVRAELKFDPSIGPEAIEASLWLFDRRDAGPGCAGSECKWYRSQPIQVGGSARNELVFDLDDPSHFASCAGCLPPSAVGPGALKNLLKVGIQLWANRAYTGRITLDNVTIGGVEIPNFRSANTGFVTRCDNQLCLNGQPYRFTGTNNYYQFYKSHYMIDSVMDTMQRNRLPVLRTWGFADGTAPFAEDGDGLANGNEGHAFQPEQGLYYEPTFVNFDYVLRSAGEHGVRLVLPLVNHWSDKDVGTGQNSFGGMGQYLEWCGVAQYDGSGRISNKALFYTDPCARQLFENYIATMINRVNTLTGTAYKDDPTILAWELANEPRCEASDGCPGEDAAYNWIAEMSAYIKSLDPRHLVAVGDEGFLDMPDGADEFYNGQYNMDWEATLNLPTIDIGTVHSYPENWGQGADWATRWINDHITIGRQIGKPLMFEEYGIRSSDRNTTYEDWAGLFERGATGDLVWMIAGEVNGPQEQHVELEGKFYYPDYDGFTFWEPIVETMDIIRHHADAMAGKEAHVRFEAGWNLFALHVSPTVSLAAQMALDGLNSEDGDPNTRECTEIYRWLNGGWDAHIDLLQFNDFPIELGQGYFVKCKSAVLRTYTGAPLLAGVTLNLTPGWNLVSTPYPPDHYTAQSLLDAINDQGGQCTEINRWLAAAWDAHINDLPFNNFAIMPEGYFIRCSTFSEFTPALPCAHTALSAELQADQISAQADAIRFPFVLQ